VNTPYSATPIGIVSANSAGSVITLVLDQPVTLSGVPGYTTDLSGVTAVSAGLTSPAQLAVTFSGAITTATALNIPFNEPAVRNAAGGFVVPTSFPV
jgi:hypothetical protein